MRLTVTNGVVRDGMTSLIGNIRSTICQPPTLGRSTNG
jgi:hypothetical protein